MRIDLRDISLMAAHFIAKKRNQWRGGEQT
jgi:hypothetical protein